MTDPESQIRAARLLHLGAEHLSPGDPLVPPITASATFHLPGEDGVARAAGQIYGRNDLPIWRVVEERLALLEGAEAVAFPSGMAAISAAFFATLKAGDLLILPSDGYYVTRLLASGFLEALGVTVRAIPTRDFASHDFTGASVVHVETPSNPGLDAVDLRDVAARAHAAGAKVIADNTTMTALLQRPLDLGCDIVVAADTKAPSGHSDLLFGHVATRDPDLLTRMRDWRRISGAIPGPFEAFLLHRGLETLELRLSRMCSSAEVIAERLAAHPAVSGLRYPGLATDPSHAVTRAQAANGGFLICFELPTAAMAEAFLSACPLIAQTTSFGGAHSSAERRARWGDAVAPGFIRLSIGVEPLEPLWQAIAAALDSVSAG